MSRLHTVVEQGAVRVASRPELLGDDALPVVEAAGAVLEIDLVAGARRVDGRPPALPVVGMHERLVQALVVVAPAQRAAHQRLAVRAPVHGAMAAVGVDAEREQVGVHRIDDLRQRRMRLRQLGPHPPAVGDVGDDAADLERSVGVGVGDCAVVHPAGDAVGAAEAVLDLGVDARRERRVEGVVLRAVVGMDGGVPVLHLGVRLGAAQQPVGARTLEELLQAAVRIRHGEVDVLAHDVEEPREAVAGERELGRHLVP